MRERGDRPLLASRKKGRAALTDSEIIRLLEERDENALCELERKYYPFCRAVA